MILKVKNKNYTVKIGTAAVLRFQKVADLEGLKKGNVELEVLVDLAVCGIKRKELPEDIDSFKEDVYSILDDNFHLAQQLIEQMSSLMKASSEAKK